MIDYASVYLALYNAVKTGSAGATARGLTGGTSSVFERKQLGNTAGKVLPWLVFAHGPISGARNEMRDLNAAWWAYVAPITSEQALFALAHAIDLAYADVNSISWGRVGVGALGEPYADAALGNLLALRIPVIYRALG